MNVVYSLTLLISYLFAIVTGCADTSTHCGDWKKAGFCAPNSPYFLRVLPLCPKTCDLCGGASNCFDKMGSQCLSYNGYCQHKDYKDYLITNCKKYCNYCHITTRPPPPTTTNAPTQPYTGASGRTIQPGCGKKGPGHTRIVGGKNAKPGDWPWQVTLDYKYNVVNPGHSCGGTLITEEWVVSAAHCFYDDQNKDNYWLKLGEHNLKTNSSWEQRFEIEELLLHPKYVHSGFKNDLALIRLKRNATLNSRVQTACLPGRNVSFPVGTKCYITGWGYLKDYGAGPAILQQAQVPLVDRSKCVRAYKAYHETITPSMLCAGYTNGTKDACTGDSGGPLVCKHHDYSLGEDIWYLWGTISWGIGCAREGLYGVFTGSKYMRSWIDQVVFNETV